MEHFIEVLRDAQARVVRLGEAFRDGDHEFVAVALDDLERELWETVAGAERSLAAALEPHREAGA